jgi:photosystem II stability/assembly factor-like uncharacterized protein
MKIQVLIICLLLSINVYPQKKKSSNSIESKTALDKANFSGMKFRSVGPALTSGRIADIAVNPNNFNEYYVATASGGVWKTINNGNTFAPLFDEQGSSSIGCVRISPHNPNEIWVGTGENNNQRSVSYGDGIYKSLDGGKSWKNLGLKNSEHIGSIVFDPENSNTIYVAAIGPLWSKGGDRGVYKTINGGKTWERVLNIDEHTGVNEVVMDPTNSSILYASAYQRRRHVFTYLGGGPGSGIYKSEDAGRSWKRANSGLPKVDMGRIGFAISPANPEYIYAIVEAAQNKGGFYISTNRGASWQKRSKFVTSGNYYQEIIADPINPDKIYAMNNWQKVSTDGGRTFKNIGEDFKHIDNHALWVDPTNTQHMLSGNDGGVYETWDAGGNWAFKANLPVTQFYKVAVDNAEPFYNIYGGTQDNFSLGGPSRTTSGNGPNNFDWFITHGGDGFESQVDPGNPDIVYAQSQYGFLVRYDKKSGEEKGIKPMPRKDENSYRWNWDAPLQVSTHKNERIYFAANKLFKSDDRGDSWEVLGDDLTRSIDRNKLPIMDRIWGVDAVMKNQSTSPYGTIVAFSESPLDENLLYVGTDDGLIQITEDGGKNWTKISAFPGVPTKTYVNMVFASKHNKNVVYACFNNHKNGDFKPYIFRSEDKGRAWSNISANLPKRGSTYALEEDHIDANLLFVGTEFGAFFSDNRGTEWKQLKAGLPTVAVRDLTIQKQHNDLVLATFGRGFYVLDDYSSLRGISSKIGSDAQLFGVRDALQFENSMPLGLPGKAFMGDDFYIGENLGSEAIFTWYLKDELKSKSDIRKEAEKKGGNISYPSYETLRAEKLEQKPSLLLTIKNDNGTIVKKISKDIKKGLQRTNWDLRYESSNPINLRKPSFYNPFGGNDAGTLVEPGNYTVSLSKLADGQETQLAEPVAFKIKALNNTVLPATDRNTLVAFQTKVNTLSGRISSAQNALRELKGEMKFIRVAIDKTPSSQSELMNDYAEIQSSITDIENKLNGDPIATKLDLDRPPSISNRIGLISYEQSNSTSKPTKTHLDTYEIAKTEFEPIYGQVKALISSKLEALRKKLKASGAPYTPGNLNFID